MNFGSHINNFLNFPAKKVATGKNSDLDNLPLNLSLNVNLLYPVQQAGNFSSRILHFADWQNLEKKESNNLLNNNLLINPLMNNIFIELKGGETG